MHSMQQVLDLRRKKYYSSPVLTSCNSGKGTTTHSAVDQVKNLTPVLNFSRFSTSHTQAWCSEKKKKKQTESVSHSAVLNSLQPHVL